MLCADVGGMKQLIGQWMGGLLGSESQDRMDRGDRNSASVADDNQSLVGGLSHFLAEILAKLETAYGGAPLDVEISYEMDDDVSPAIFFRSSHLSVDQSSSLFLLVNMHKAHWQCMKQGSSTWA